MSNIPYDDLLAKFKSLADDLIEHINATTVTLYFEPAERTNVSPDGLAGTNIPNVYDIMGGRTNIQSLPGGNSEEGNNISDIPTTLDIKARVYWQNKNRYKVAEGIYVTDRKDVCQVVTYIEYQQDLLNATYALINGYKCARTKEPVPHGMGNFYVESEWEIISS